MTQEEKDLLLKDLCARLPYGVQMYDKYAYPYALCYKEGNYKLTAQDISDYSNEKPYDNHKRLENVKPYLRPMESMTEEESKEYTNIDNRSYSCPKNYAHIPASDRIDWLNKHHFDYRGLIEKGLALEAPKGTYN